MKISQFHSGVAVGDAITNQMLEIKKILQKNNYDTKIYAEYIPLELSSEVSHINDYNDDDILIIHHSMGFNCFDKIVSTRAKKILIYHNITPEEFFNDYQTKQYIRLGIKQLEEYKKYVDYVIAASNYNRKQMLSHGYKNRIDVMPVNISLDRLDRLSIVENIYNQYKDSTNILFVGRIVANKCQLDILKTFAIYQKKYNPNSKLFLVGNVTDGSYLDKIKNFININNLQDNVILTGSVGEEELKTYYSLADVFLCMSEHEGFGVPLLESMKMQVPTIAFESSAIAETMGGAGVLIREKKHDYIAALIDEIVNNEQLNKNIIEQQNKRIEEMNSNNTETIILNAIHSLEKNNKKSIQLQGPFETSYSLAIVNRELITSLDNIGDYNCSIHCTEGPGDYEPKLSDLEDKPKAKELWENGFDYRYPDITIRNMYPPRVHDVNGGINFQFFGWEESYIPKEYIDNFNKYLNGIGTMSNYVTNKLIENGVTIPVRTIGVGVSLPDNFDELKKYNFKTKKRVKFLHISSAFPRKGVDILLKSYFNTFDANDDVCLVLKTFPNPHNNIDVLLKSLKKENNPEVEWIDTDLSKDEIYSLYKSCDCYVQVSRGEGFGLPVAEAMLSKIPVIVSPNSGLADFCNDSTALLVNFADSISKTHINNYGKELSLCFEPSQDSLEKRLREFYEQKDIEDRNLRIKNAYELIKTEYSWEKMSKKWQDFINDVENNLFIPKVSIVTTWNTKCGIAEYSKMAVYNSKHLIDYRIYPDYGKELLFDDEPFVAKRLWEHNCLNQDLYPLTKELISNNDDIINIQISFGFFNIEELKKLIRKLSQVKKVVLSFHEVKDTIVGNKTISLSSMVDEINMCKAIIIFQEKEKQYLIDIGVKEELIKIVPLGQLITMDVPSKIQKQINNIQSDHVIGSYGFLLPHKGTKEIIESVNLLKDRYPDIKYLSVSSLYDAPESVNYYKECMETIKKYNLKDNVTIITEFLSNEQSLNYLQCCDLLLMPYIGTQQSASGAIRQCIAAKRPIVTTNLPIFDEFKEYVYQINKPNSNEIVESIIEYFETDKFDKYIKKQEEYLQDNSWSKTTKTMYDIYLDILNVGKRCKR